MAVLDRPVGSTEYLAEVHAFSGKQLELPVPADAAPGTTPSRLRLPDTELVKVSDLCEDIKSFATGVDAVRLEQSTLLGRKFAWFERVAGRPVPKAVHRAMRAVKRSLGVRPRPRATPWKAHEVPPGSSPAPVICAAEFHLFDRLSQIYGGNFRGSVVVNCLLGVAASTALLLSLTRPAFAQWIGALLPKFMERVPMATIVELICLLAIVYIYLYGRTPENDEEGDEPPPSLSPHWGAKRWHQRWLEYRLLAERFRYVDLLLPLGADVMRSLAIAPPHSASRMWHQRYFEWCVHRVSSATQSVAHYRDHALAAIAEQEAYHVRNHHRRGTIAHRLHRCAKYAFIGALGICVIDIGIAAYHWAMSHGTSAPEIPNATLLFFAAWLPVISAATYAILTHAEYAKAADASGEVFERIHLLYEQLSAMPVSGEGATRETLRGMRSIVIEFAETSITEATGWRAMLRDKNVPLG